MAEDLRESGIG